jgi:hypothetical protein
LIKFGVIIKTDKPVDILRKEFNGLVREALTAAGITWIKDFLPLHFTYQAISRYAYEPRTKKYALRKNKPNRFIKKGRVIPSPTPQNAPFVWSGDTKAMVLGRSPSDFNLKVTATSNKQMVKVPIKTPHAFNPKNSGELGRLGSQDFQVMTDIANAKLIELVKNFKRPTVTKIG